MDSSDVVLTPRRAQVNPVAWRYANVVLAAFGALARVKSGREIGAIPCDVAADETARLHAVLQSVEDRVMREVRVL